MLLSTQLMKILSNRKSSLFKLKNKMADDANYFIGTWRIAQCIPLTSTASHDETDAIESAEFQLDESGDVIWKVRSETAATIPLFSCETYAAYPDNKKTLQFFGAPTDDMIEFRVDISSNLMMVLIYDEWCILRCIKQTIDHSEPPYSLHNALEEGFFSDITFVAQNGRKYCVHSTILQLSNPSVDWKDKQMVFHTDLLAEDVLYTVLYYMYTECLPVTLTEDVAKQSINAVQQLPGFNKFVSMSEMFLKSAALKQQIKSLILDMHACVARIVDLFNDKAQNTNSEYGSSCSHLLNSPDFNSGENIAANPVRLCYVIKQSLREIVVAGAKCFLICDLFTRKKNDMSREERHEIIEFTRSRLRVFIGQVRMLFEILKQKFSMLTSLQRHDIAAYLVPEIEASLTTTSDLTSQAKVILEQIITRTTSSETANKASADSTSSSTHKPTASSHKSKKFSVGSLLGDSLRNALHMREMLRMRKFYEKFASGFMNLLQKRSEFCQMGTQNKIRSVTKSLEQLVTEDIPYILLQLNMLNNNIDEKLSWKQWKCLFKVGASKIAWILNKLRDNSDFISHLIVRLCDLVRRDQFDKTAYSLCLFDDKPGSSQNSCNYPFNFIESLKVPPPVRHSIISQRALTMFHNGEETDMSFVLTCSSDDGDDEASEAEPSNNAANQQVIKAHCVIIASRCDWFRRALLSGMRESIEKKIYVHDVNVPTFNLFLDYLYCGYLFTHDLSAEELTDLLILGDRYEVDHLRHKSEQALRDHVNEDTALSLVSIAEQLNLRSLKTTAIEYITRHTDLLDSEDFSKLDKELQSEIQNTVSWLSPRVLSPEESLLAESCINSGSSSPSSSSSSSSNASSPLISSRPRNLAQMVANLQLSSSDPNQMTEDLSLSAQDSLRLEECVSGLREVVGESVSQAGLVRLSLAADFDVNRALNFFFSS